MKDFDKAILRFEEVINRYEKKYQAYIKGLLEKKEQYLNHLKYPESVRKYIYTTNIEEKINNRIDLSFLDSIPRHNFLDKWISLLPL